MVRLRPATTLLPLAFAVANAFAADCRPDPLEGRLLYLRGTLNDWGADDDAALRWTCDHWAFTGRIDGDVRFKIGDEDWSADADFGAAGETSIQPATPVTLVPKGAPLQATLHGMARVTLSPPASPGGAPTLLLTGLPPDTPIPTPPASTITDPVARSLAFDSQALADKAPYGAVPVGTDVAFSLRALAGIEQVTLVVEKRRLEGDQTIDEYAELARVSLARTGDGAHERWSGHFRFDAAAVYGYWFEVTVGGRTLVFENNATPLYWTREKGVGGVGTVADMPSSAKRIRRYRQTVYAPYAVPDWARDAVWYDIFPERFRNGDRRNDPKPGVDAFHDRSVEFHANWNDKPFRPNSGDGSDDQWSNDFFGGDLAGIIDKLDYIRSVGANTLYITPMFTAASNHKYDTADWKHIDPHFGSDADFARLCREAARRGIRVVPDASFNHSGADSVYFDRYGTRGGHGAFENGRIDADSPWARWYRFDASQPDPDQQYKGWLGVSDLPELDKADPSFRDFAYRAPDAVTKTWLQRGASGWRMDVAPWVPDDFWREWRTEVKRTKPDAVTVAEAWWDASKFFLGDEFDSAMNYIFRDAVLAYANGGDARRMVANLEHLREAYPPQSFNAMMNVLSTHDTARSLHVLGDVDGQSAPAQVALAKRKLLLAMLIQMTYPGAPAIFYGDEVGVTGGSDPMNRGTYPWADRGGHPDAALLARVRRLTTMRHDWPVLRRGTLLAPLHVDAHVVVLARTLRTGPGASTQWAITATNNGASAQGVDVALPAEAVAAHWRSVTTGARADSRVDAATHARFLRITVPPGDGVVWVDQPSRATSR